MSTGMDAWYFGRAELPVDVVGVNVAGDANVWRQNAIMLGPTSCIHGGGNGGRGMLLIVLDLVLVPVLRVVDLMLVSVVVDLVIETVPSFCKVNKWYNLNKIIITDVPMPFH
jgi:hypothetical protein